MEVGYYERGLRCFIAVTILPGAVLLMAAGVMSDKAVDHRWYSTYYPKPGPAYFGIIPMFFSTLSSLGFLFLQSKFGDDIKRWHTKKWMLVDLVLVLGHIGILIPIWVIEPRKLKDRADYMMLETYATCFLLMNMCAHAYLFLYHANKVVDFFGKNQAECPHCHHKLAAGKETQQNGEGYSLLRAEDYLDEEGDASDAVPRPSVEEV